MVDASWCRIVFHRRESCRQFPPVQVQWDGCLAFLLADSTVWSAAGRWSGDYRGLHGAAQICRRTCWEANHPFVQWPNMVFRCVSSPTHVLLWRYFSYSSGKSCGLMILASNSQGFPGFPWLGLPGLAVVNIDVDYLRVEDEWRKAPVPKRSAWEVAADSLVRCNENPCLYVHYIYTYMYIYIICVHRGVSESCRQKVKQGQGVMGSCCLQLCSKKLSRLETAKLVMNGIPFWSINIQIHGIPSNPSVNHASFGQEMQIPSSDLFLHRASHHQ